MVATELRMDASFKTCGIAFFIYMQLNNTVSFSVIGGPPALRIQYVSAGNVSVSRALPDNSC